MEFLAVAITGIAAYFIGAIPPAYFLVRALKGVDLREVGSRNVGTLNTYHQVGWWGAGLVLVLDVGKGVLAALLPAWVGLPEWAIYLTGPLVVAGHNWTFILGFRGGKGAAPVIGVCLGFLLIPTAIAIIPGILALLVSRNAIIGLAVGYALFNLLIIIAAAFNLNWLAPGAGVHHVGFSIALTLMVTVSYAVSIHRQLLTALQHRSLREVFYGS